jgi:methyl-accepting chemotaxis protein
VAVAALPTWGGAYRQEDDTMRIDDLRISTRLELGFGVLGLMILAMVAVVWVQVSTMTGLFGDGPTRAFRAWWWAAPSEDVQAISSSVRNMILMSDTAAIMAEARA